MSSVSSNPYDASPKSDKAADSSGERAFQSGEGRKCIELDLFLIENSQCASSATVIAAASEYIILCHLLCMLHAM